MRLPSSMSSKRSDSGMSVRSSDIFNIFFDSLHHDHQASRVGYTSRPQSSMSAFAASESPDLYQLQRNRPWTAHGSGRERDAKPRPTLGGMGDSGGKDGGNADKAKGTDRQDNWGGNEVGRGGLYNAKVGSSSIASSKAHHDERGTSITDKSSGSHSGIGSGSHSSVRADEVGGGLEADPHAGGGSIGRFMSEVDPATGEAISIVPFGGVDGNVDGIRKADAAAAAMEDDEDAWMYQTGVNGKIVTEREMSDFRSSFENTSLGKFHQGGLGLAGLAQSILRQRRNGFTRAYVPTVRATRSGPAASEGSSPDDPSSMKFTFGSGESRSGSPTKEHGDGDHSPAAASQSSPPRSPSSPTAASAAHPSTSSSLFSSSSLRSMSGKTTTSGSR